MDLTARAPRRGAAFRNNYGCCFTFVCRSDGASGCLVWLIPINIPPRWGLLFVSEHGPKIIQLGHVRNLYRQLRQERHLYRTPAKKTISAPEGRHRESRSAVYFCNPARATARRD